MKLQSIEVPIRCTKARKLLGIGHSRMSALKRELGISGKQFILLSAAADFLRLNPGWSGENPMTIDTKVFNRWLAQQPDEREFEYCDICQCLFSSFAREALGFKSPSSGGDYVREQSNGRWLSIPPAYAHAAARAFPLTIADFKAALAKELHKEVV